MDEKKRKNKATLTTLKEIFTNKAVLQALLITFVLLVLFHLGTIVTIPGIVLPDEYQQASDSFVGMLNLLAGGGLSRMSIFAVGVGPYITAQIIVQLLSSDLVPPLSRMAKSGERGRRKLEVITRLITLPFAVAQAYAIIALIMSTGSGITVFGASTLGDIPINSLIALIVILVAGTYIAIFIGDIITKRGVGNGITLLILAGIVSSIIGNFQVAFQTIATSISPDKSAYVLTVLLSFLLYLIFFICIFLAIIFVNGSSRKIPIQQTGQGLTSDIKNLPFLPIKLNAAGVIPVIFASSIMTIPGTIAQFLPEDSAKWFIEDYLTMNS